MVVAHFSFPLFVVVVQFCMCLPLSLTHSVCP